MQRITCQTRVITLVITTVLVGFAPLANAQDNKPGKKGKKDDVKKYDDVIPEDAVTQPGLFIVHEVGEDLYYEIPTETFGKDMVWVTQIAETTAGHSYAGMPAAQETVRWEKRGEKVLLRDVRYGIRAETDDPIAIAVEKTNLAPIIKTFDVEAYGKDKRPVIKVTSLFTNDVPEFSARRSLNAGGMDGGRTFIEKVKAFEENINVAVLATYKPEGRNARSSGITAVVHHSMVKLPKDPMQPRVHDARVGFFSVGFTDFADDSRHEARRVRYITRWRLEKKNPDQELSEPEEPIVFYVGRAVPEKWKPFVKAGIEDWQPAFEAAGFTNAIIGKYPPDPAENPDWDPEDARISSIRWLPSTTENAFGPHVHDPRTGEIIEADIRMYHNVEKLVRDWYFAQCAAVDERAQDLPMPDELMGRLIQFVVAHEVGHSLGFPHNFKASNAYTVEQLRDPQWTKKNGTAPSIMDYARFNYVAQPGDGAGLLPQVGPYDKFATEWGYRQFPDDADEKAELEQLIKKQIDNPMYRFGGGPGDPSSQTEDLGRNAVKATRLGLKNLKRIAGFIVEATSEQGEDYDLLNDMYSELIGQWNREMRHVANVVAGIEQVNLYYGDADQRYFPVEPDYQRDAVAFLVEHALHMDEELTSPDIVLRLTPSGTADRVLSGQRRLIATMVSDFRIKRLAEIADRTGEDAYQPTELLDDLRLGIFEELQDDNTVDINLYRRNLQRAYVDLLINRMKSAGADSDLPGLARVELRELDQLLDRALDHAHDRIIGAHLEELRARIADAFDQDD